MRQGNLIQSLKKNGGFSLIELMIVLVIIGILVAILIPNMLDALHRSRQRATMGEMRAWANALGAYMAEVGTVPAGTGAPINASTIHNQLVPYAVSALHDDDRWHNPFLYTADTLAGTPINYTIMSTGKNGIPDICISPASWFNYNEDIKLLDGLFVCSPS